MSNDSTSTSTPRLSRSMAWKNSAREVPTAVLVVMKESFGSPAPPS